MQRPELYRVAVTRLHLKVEATQYLVEATTALSYYNKGPLDSRWEGRLNYLDPLVALVRPLRWKTVLLSLGPRPLVFTLAEAVVSARHSSLELLLSRAH